MTPELWRMGAEDLAAAQRAISDDEADAAAQQREPIPLLVPTPAATTISTASPDVLRNPELHLDEPIGQDRVLNATLDLSTRSRQGIRVIILFEREVPTLYGHEFGTRKVLLLAIAEYDLKKNEWTLRHGMHPTFLPAVTS